MSLSVLDQLLHATVRIECILKNGLTSTGTGFIYAFQEQEGSDLCAPTLITNKHVIKDADKGIIHFTLSDSNYQPIIGKKHQFVINNFESSWLPHPDPSVDLAVLPGTSQILKHGIDSGVPLFCKSINKSVMLTDEEKQKLDPVEDIIMIGYPIGLWDSVNNLPIVRRGITATHPNIDYNGSSEFLIDAACFPGSSGSPVFILKQGVFPTPNGVSIGKKISLLGILYAGPQHTATGQIQVVDIPTRQEPIAISRIPMNLGYVIKADRIKDFEILLPKK